MKDFRNKNDIMDRRGIEIATDFQGWPIYKRTWNWILEKIGALKEGDCADSKIEYTKVFIPTKVLEQYPIIEEDDGMGYSPYSRWITDVFIDPDGAHRVWIDSEIVNTPIEEELEPKTITLPYKEYKDLYYEMGWPDVQQYMGKNFDKIKFDPSKNVWFVPAYLV